MVAKDAATGMACDDMKECTTDDKCNVRVCGCVCGVVVVVVVVVVRALCVCVCVCVFALHVTRSAR
jgi:hypothetical protein